jgi:RHS repeat-associated protein
MTLVAHLIRSAAVRPYFRLVTRRASPLCYAALALILIAVWPGDVHAAASIDEASGALRWEFPLALPQGRQEMTPGLGLTYSSAGGLSDFGFGFSLNEETIVRSSAERTPALDTTDEFDLVIGATQQEMVAVGSVDGCDEYRTLLDPDDLQVLRCGNSIENSEWRVLYRDGRTKTFLPALYVVQANGVSDVVLDWKLARVSDTSGNHIDYEYRVRERAARALDDNGVDGRLPLLTAIHWGGNQHASPAIPHAYHVELFRDGELPPSDAPVDLVSGRGLAECEAARGFSLRSFRQGGMLHDASKVWSLVRAVVVSTASPGTTDGAVEERVRRVSSVYQFTYNWDRVGCHDDANLWPLLEGISLIGVATNGDITRAPEVRLGYNSFARDIHTRSAGDFPAAAASLLPSSQGLHVNQELFEGLETSIANDDPFPGPYVVEESVLHNQGIAGNDYRNPAHSSGMTQFLADVDEDGIVDLVDMQGDYRCFRSTAPSHGVWFQGVIDRDGGYSLSQVGLDLSAWTNVLSAEFRNFIPIPLLSGGYTNRNTCGFSTNLQLTRALSPTDVSISATQSSALDLDRDGKNDLVVGDAWYRNISSGTALAFAAATPLPEQNMPWLEHGNLAFGTFSLRQQNLGAFSALNVFAPSTSPGGRGLGWSSTEIGHLADVTGDGLADRLALETTASGTRMLIFRGLPNLAFSGPEVWWESDTGDQIGHNLSPSENWYVGMSASISPYHGWTDVQSQDLVDINGDGLLDIIRADVTPHYGYSGDVRIIPLSYLEVDPNGAMVHFNYGRGFAAAPARWPHQPTVLRQQLNGDAEEVAPGKYRRRFQRNIRLVDYNGDGFVDILGANYVQLNLGGHFAPPHSIDTQYILADHGFADIGFVSLDGVVSSTKQIVSDLNSDGRPDILRVRYTRDGNRLELSTDRILTPPGRLIEIADGVGGIERIAYSTMAQARVDSQRGNDYRAQGFVVSSISRYASADAAPQVWSYKYHEGVVANSTASRTGRVGHLGFKRVEECAPTHLRRIREFDFSNGRPGLLVRDSAFRNPSGAPTKCSDAVVVASERYFSYEDVAVPTDLNSGRVHRYLPTWMVATTSAEDEYGGQVYADTGSFMEYVPGTTLLQRTTTYGSFATPADDVVEQTGWEFPHGRLARVQYIVHEAADGSFSRTDHAYSLTHPSLATQQRVWRSRTESSATVYEYDDAGLLLRTTSAAGRTTDYCWDAYGLFIVASLDNRGARVESVYDMATGAELQKRGPVGLGLHQAGCPARAQATNIAERSQDRLVLSWAPPQSNKPDVVVDLVSLAMSRPPSFVDDPALHPTVRRPRAPVNVAVQPLESLRVLRGRDIFQYYVSTSQLGSTPAPLQPSVNVPLVRREFDGLSRILREVGVVSRDSTGAYVLAEITTHRYQDGPLGRVHDAAVAVDVPSPSATQLTLLRPELAAHLRTITDGLGQVRTRLKRRFDSAQAQELTPWEETLRYDQFGAFEIESPSPSSDTARVTQRVVARTDPLGRVTRFGNALGEHTYAAYFGRYVNDDLGARMVSIDRARDEHFYYRETEHDPVTRTTKSRAFLSPGDTSGPSVETAMTYDAFERPIVALAAGGLRTEFEYDSASQLKRARRYHPNGHVVHEREYTYDQDGMIAIESNRWADGSVDEIAFGRDTQTGRVQTMFAPSEPFALPGYGNVVYIYGDDPAQTSFDQLVHLASPNEVVSYEYDARGFVKTENHDVDVEIGQRRLHDVVRLDFEATVGGLTKSVTFEGLSLHYVYDNLGRTTAVHELDTLRGTSTLSRFEYTLAGQRRSRQDTGGLTEQLQYDHLGRPHSLTLGAANGSIALAQNVTFWQNSWVDRITTSGLGVPTHSMILSHDGAGRLTEAHAPQLGYRTRLEYQGDHIASCSESLPGQSQSSLVYEYKSAFDGDAVTALRLASDMSQGSKFMYDQRGAAQKRGGTTHRVDPLGRPGRQGAEEYLASPGGELTHFTNSDTHELHAHYGWLDLTYKDQGEWVRSEEELIASVDGEDTIRVRRDGRRSFMYRDVQGSVVHVANNQGSSTTQLFSPFGNRLFGAGHVQEERRGFQGGLVDATNAAGWFFGVRHYDATTKRFSSRDPLAFELSTEDPYAFAANNPVLNRDPDGRQPEPTPVAAPSEGGASRQSIAAAEARAQPGFQADTLGRPLWSNSLDRHGAVSKLVRLGTTLQEVMWTVQVVAPVTALAVYATAPVAEVSAAGTGLFHAARMGWAALRSPTVARTLMQLGLLARAAPRLQVPPTQAALPRLAMPGHRIPTVSPVRPVATIGLQPRPLAPTSRIRGRVTPDSIRTNRGFITAPVTPNVGEQPVAPRSAIDPLESRVSELLTRSFPGQVARTSHPVELSAPRQTFTNVPTQTVHLTDFDVQMRNGLVIEVKSGGLSTNQVANLSELVGANNVIIYAPNTTANARANFLNTTGVRVLSTEADLVRAVSQHLSQ